MNSYNYLIPTYFFKYIFLLHTRTPLFPYVSAFLFLLHTSSDFSFVSKFLFLFSFLFVSLHTHRAGHSLTSPLCLHFFVFYFLSSLLTSDTHRVGHSLTSPLCLHLFVFYFLSSLLTSHTHTHCRQKESWHSSNFVF